MCIYSHGLSARTPRGTGSDGHGSDPRREISAHRTCGDCEKCTKEI